MSAPFCISCNVSMNDVGNVYSCPGCDATIPIPKEPERHFSMPVAQKVKPEKKKRVKRENSVVKFHRVGNIRILHLKDGSTLKVGPRPELDYFP